MTPDELLRGAAVHTAAGEHDEALDVAALAYARAGAGTDLRVRAGIAVAAALEAKGLIPDTIDWTDRVLAERPGCREALAYRGWAHHEARRTAEALADLDAAVAPHSEDPHSEDPHSEDPHNGNDIQNDAPDEARLNRALVFDSLGRRADAIAELGHLVDVPAYAARALRIRGLLRTTHDPARAAADLRAAARLGDLAAVRQLRAHGDLPDEPAMRYADVRLRYLDDRPDDARARADELLADPGALDPATRAKLLDYRGWVLATDAQDGVGHLRRAAGLAPDDAAILTHLGRTLFNADRDDEAAAVLARAVAARAGDGLAERYLGDLHGYAERWAEADRWYQRSLHHAPASGPALFGRAVALVALSHQGEGAPPPSRSPETLSHQGEGAPPANRRPEEAVALALRAAVRGHQRAAGWLAERGVETPAARFDRGLRAMGRTDLAAAEQHFRVAAAQWLDVSRAPGDYAARHAAMALGNAAYCRSQRGDRDAAAGLARRAVELRPGLRDGWNTLGNELAALGRLDEALAAYERCARCDPAYPGARSGAADVLRRLGRGDAAVTALDRALDRAIANGTADAGHTDLYRRRGRLHHARGDFAAAAADYRAAGDRDLLTGLETITAWLATAADLAPRPTFRGYGLRTPARSGPVRWRVRFRSAPDGGTRLRVAAAVQEAARVEPAGGTSAGTVVGEPWLWSGRFLLMSLRRADPAVAAAVHAAAPVVEVVSYTAGTLDGSDHGSVLAKAVPDAGPEFPVVPRFWVPELDDTTAYPQPAADPAVEALLAGSSLKIERFVVDPCSGVNDGPPAVRAAFWCHTGPAGVSLVVEQVAGGYEILAGDADGVHPIVPPLRGESFLYSWRPDGRGVMLRDKRSGVHYDLDLVRRMAEPVLTGADDACHLAAGIAALRDGDLVIYGPGGGVELGRLALPDGVGYFGWAARGRVLHLTRDDRTAFLAVADGRLYPIAACPAAAWFMSFERDGALFLQTQDPGAGFRAVRVTGFDAAIARALAREPLRRLDFDRLPMVGLVDREGS